MALIITEYFKTNGVSYKLDFFGCNNFVICQKFTDIAHFFCKTHIHPEGVTNFRCRIIDGNQKVMLTTEYYSTLCQFIITNFST